MCGFHQITSKVHTFSTFTLTISSPRFSSHFSHSTIHLFSLCTVQSVAFILFDFKKNGKYKQSTTPLSKHTKIICTGIDKVWNVHTFSIIFVASNDAQRKWNVVHCPFVQFGHQHSVWQYSLPLTLTLNTIIRISSSLSSSCVLCTENNASWLQLIPYWYGHISDRIFCGCVRCNGAMRCNTLRCQCLYFNAHVFRCCSFRFL